MSHLWNLNADQLDLQNKDHILEQYKLYVEMADRISSRRGTANTFFLSLNGSITGLAGYSIDKGILIHNVWIALFFLFLLLLECFFWWRLINSYKQLNTAKFIVVGELEERLPSSPYQKAEWQHHLKEGKDKSVYWPLTDLELKIPIIFSVLYILIYCVMVFKC